MFGPVGGGSCYVYFVLVGEFSVDVLGFEVVDFVGVSFVDAVVPSSRVCGDHSIRVD